MNEKYPSPDPEDSVGSSAPEVSVERGAKQVSDLAEKLKAAEFLHQQELKRNLEEREMAIQNERLAAKHLKEADKKVAGLEKDQASGGIKSEEGQKIVEELKSARDDMGKSFSGIKGSVDATSGRSGMIDAIHDEAQKEQKERDEFEQQLEKIKRIKVLHDKGVALFKEYADGGPTSIRAISEQKSNSFHRLREQLAQGVEDRDLRRAIYGVDLQNHGEIARQNIQSARSGLGLLRFRDKGIADRAIKELLDSAKLAYVASEQYNNLYKQRFSLVAEANKLRREIQEYTSKSRSAEIIDRIKKELGEALGQLKWELYSEIRDFQN